MVHDVSSTADAWDIVLHENVKGFPESIMAENLGSLCFALKFCFLFETNFRMLDDSK